MDGDARGWEGLCERGPVGAGKKSKRRSVAIARAEASREAWERAR